MRTVDTNTTPVGRFNSGNPLAPARKMSSTRNGEVVSQRRSLVLREVLSGRGQVEELSEHLAVSQATVRRDLQFLSDTGRTSRTYGGAIAVPRRLELSLQQKEVQNQSEKEAIARRAASLVQDGDSLILDAGTTVGRLALELRTREGLSICTNGVSSILTLAESDGISLIVLGGQLRPISQALIGPLAEATLSRITADKAFLGADGLASEGICCPTAAHGSLKGLMVQRSRDVIVLADHTKLGNRPYHHWAPFNRPFTLITDGAAPSQYLDQVQAAGGTVLIADGEAVPP